MKNEELKNIKDKTSNENMYTIDFFGVY